MRVVSLFILVLAVGLVTVTAQAPQEKPAPEANTPLAREQQPPPPVPPQPTPSDSSRTASGERQPDTAWAQRLTLGSTVVQAVSAFIVMVFTFFLLWYSARGWRVAREAADAAKENAETATLALNMAHRPKLVVRQAVVDGFDASGRLAAETLTNGQLWVTNVGVLPATLLRVHVEWLFADKLPIRNPVLDVVDSSTTPTVMQPASFVRIAIPDRAITTDEHVTINNAVDGIGPSFGQRVGTVFLIGYIKYSDVIGLRRRYFCKRFEPTAGYFADFEHPSYSYED